MRMRPWKAASTSHGRVHSAGKISASGLDHSLNASADASSRTITRRSLRMADCRTTVTTATARSLNSFHDALKRLDSIGWFAERASISIRGVPPASAKRPTRSIKRTAPTRARMAAAWDSSQTSSASAATRSGKSMRRSTRQKKSDRWNARQSVRITCPLPRILSTNRQ